MVTPDIKKNRILRYISLIFKEKIRSLPKYYKIDIKYYKGEFYKVLKKEF